MPHMHLIQIPSQSPVVARKRHRLHPAVLIVACLGLSLCRLTAEAGGGHRIPALDSVERDIDEARLDAARNRLSRLERGGLTPQAEAWREVLTCRLLHDGGDWLESANRLEQMIGPLRSDARMPEVLAEAHLEYARACRSMLWIDRMNASSDSAMSLAMRHRLPDHIRMRHHTFKLLYLSLALKNAKGWSVLDSMKRLLRQASPSMSRLYQPLFASSVELTFYRNIEMGSARRMSDSVFSLLRVPDGRDQSYARIALWRAAGNFYLDRVVNDKHENPEWKSGRVRSIALFERAESILRERYPDNRGELLNLSNLKGLSLFFQKSFKGALQAFRKSERILAEPKHDVERYPYMHYQTALYIRRCIDSAYSGESLREERLRQLSRWEAISRQWSRWEDLNRDSLGHYRNQYTVDPGVMIMSLCHALYREDPDPRLLEKAFEGQERSKYRLLRKRMSEAAGLPDTSVVSLREVQRRIAPDQAVIGISEFAVIYRTTYIMLVTKDTVMLTTREEGKYMDWFLPEYQSDLICRDIQSFRNAFHGLWQFVFKDLEPHLASTKRIVVMPTGYFSLFPFGMMIPDTTGVRDFKSLRTLRERYRFSYDYSWTISEIRKSIGRPPRHSGNLLAFIPSYRTGPFYRLRFFEEQGVTLRREFGFTVNPDEGATVQQLRNGIQDAQVLHLAAHGYSSNVSSSDIFVVMDSLNTAQDHRLTAHNLIDIDTKADLAILAICMGGIGEWQMQDLKGMAYWFSYAGVRSCLFSRWKIDDRSTSIILDRFYAHLSEGMGRYEALRAAQDDYLRQARTDEERNPIYWAGLSIIGEDGPVRIDKRKAFGGIDFKTQLLVGVLVGSSLAILLARRLGRPFRSSG
jgi:hypothetical protein